MKFSLSTALLVATYASTSIAAPVSEAHKSEVATVPEAAVDYWCRRSENVNEPRCAKAKRGEEEAAVDYWCRRSENINEPRCAKAKRHEEEAAVDYWCRRAENANEPRCAK